MNKETQMSQNEVKCKRFIWYEEEEIREKVEFTYRQFILFGKKTTNHYFKYKNAYKYKTVDDLLKAAAEFIATISKENLIAVNGGDMFYYNDGLRIGGVIVWYRDTTVS
jgi:hypothetical protein